MARKTWEATEKEVCRLLGAEHVGGRGQPDCRLGALVVEVKDHARRVGPGVLRQTREKAWARGLPLIVVSTSGFTVGALAYAAGVEDVFLYRSSIDADGGRTIDAVAPPGAARVEHTPPRRSPSVWAPLAATSVRVGGLVGGMYLAFRRPPRRH